MPESSETRSIPALLPAERAEVVRCARFALAAIQREYPFHFVHVANSDQDVKPPRELHPAFGVSFDWHSAVHGHWCVLRALRFADDERFAAEVRAVLRRNLAPERIAREVEYLSAPGREGFERPYGLAWVLQLAAELREWRTEETASWRSALAPLERLALARIVEWLPRLPGPVRGGEHSQSAFSMGLALDYARAVGAREAAAVIEREAHRFYRDDRPAAIANEPSAHDFLSPALGEADLMRRVLGPGELRAWLAGCWPDGTALARWLEPVSSPDPSDGKLSHLSGLNLSRAWMLEGVISALEPDGSLARTLTRAAERHRAAGLSAVSGEHYAGSHWLGSFAVYLLTRRGLPAPR